MFGRFSIFSKFLILASTLFAVLAIILILASNIFIQNSFINRSKSIVSSAIQFGAKDLWAEDFSLKDSNHAGEVFNSFYENVKTAEIIRIKVWDYSGKVIFSDDQSIVGKSFSDNESFLEALRGNVIAEIGQKVKPENVSEQGYEQLLEVYVPIIFKGKNVPAGVIEAYFKLDNVNSQIKETQTILIAAVITFTLISFGLLFIVFRLIVYKQIERINLQAMALDNVSDHVIISDLDGIILYVNKAAEKLTGYSKDEMIGKRPSLWGKQMPKEFYEKMWKTIKIEKNDFKAEITNRRKDGVEYEAEIKISAVLDKNSNISFFVGIERDITREKEIDRAKNEFVSLASHELRTPLTAIDGIVSMILGGEYGEVNENLKEPLEDVNTSSERLVHLVNDLLNLSRIQAGKMKYTLSDFPIADVIAEAIHLLQPLSAQKGLQLIAAKLERVIVQGDLDKVKEVLNNLIGNSLKFTDKGNISISAKVARDKAEVKITDTGIGISKEDQQKLFGQFQQLESGLGKPAGTGLGLHISREMTRKMGGELWIEESEVGVGSAFTFSLPVAKSQLAQKVKNEIEKDNNVSPEKKGS